MGGVAAAGVVATRPPAADTAAIAAAYCRAGGDLAAAASTAGVTLDAARAAMRAPGWHDALRDYWREHPASVEHASLYLRDALDDPESTSAVKLKAAQLMLEHHSREQAVGVLESLVGMAQDGDASGVILEMARRNMTGLPPAQAAIFLEHAERMREADEATDIIDAEWAEVATHATAAAPSDDEYGG